MNFLVGLKTSLTISNLLERLLSWKWTKRYWSLYPWNTAGHLEWGE